MVEAKLTVPIAGSSYLYTVGEPMAVSDAKDILVDLADGYSLSPGKLATFANDGTSVSGETGPVMFLRLQLSYVQTLASQVAAKQKTPLPTAQIWIVYEIADKAGGKNSGSAGLVQDLATQRCELVYRNGSWKIAETIPPKPTTNANNKSPEPPTH